MTIKICNDLFINGTDLSYKSFMYSNELHVGGGSSGPSWQDIVLSGNGSLTLTNAKANGLNYLKLFGGTEQRNLPKGYTQYEYLRSTGTQYIDLGYKGNENTKVKVKFRYHTATSATGSGRVFGSRITSSSDAFAIGTSAGLVSSTDNKVFWCYDGQPYFIDDTAFGLDEWKTVVFSATEHTIDGITIGDDYEITEFETPNNLKLFAFDNNGTIGVGYVDIAYCQLWDNGVLVRDLVPAYDGTTYSMYDKVSNAMLPNAGTGDFIAGATAVPTPDTPMDIVCNNGVVKYGQYGKNLFDKNSSLVNGYINSSGAVVSGVLKVSTFIEIKPNTTYTISGTGDVKALSFDRYAYTYTAEQTPIAQIPSQTDGASTTFTTAQNAKYIRIQMTVAAVNTCQLELGSTATDYEPYHFGIHTEGDVETVEVTGKNLYNKANGVLYGYPTGNNTWYQEPDESGELTIMVRLEEGNTYTATRAEGSKSTFRIQASATSTLTNGQTLVNINSTGATSLTTKTFTVPYGAPYVLFYVRNTSSQSSLTVDDVINAFQVEQGSTATEYEPYFNGGSATAEMLLKVGDYQDVQSVLDGSVTRNVGVKVFDGTETFINGINGWISEDAITDQVVASNYFSLCTHFAGTNDTPQKNSNTVRVYCTSANIPRVYFGLDKTIYTSTDVFKQWLTDQYNAGTPVIIVYPLATATTETVTGQPLTIQAGTNIVEITQASMDNLELEVSYKGKV